jgi:putative endonuclease
MSQHNEVGKKGEELAKKYLEEKGYKIIEQNYRTKYAEIDLVAMKDKKMVFIEVRTKIGENFGTPEETINWNKKRKLGRNAEAYTAFKKWNGPSRIDAVCIVLSAQGGYSIERLNHYENIV